MVQLSERLPDLNDAGLQVVGISYDSEDVLKKFSDSNNISLPLLSDVDSKTIKAYGLHFEKGLPHPGTILVYETGKIRAKLFEQGYKARHTVDQLIEVKIGEDGSKP